MTVQRIRIKRVYEAAASHDGVRVLIDRMWPRGMSRQRLQADLWLKDVAPSSQLRSWFDHDCDRWPEFKRRYYAELKQQPDAVQQLIDTAAARPLTLLYAAKEPECNHAVALRDYLLPRIQ